MPAATPTKTEALADLVKRARRAGIIVRFDHAGIVVLEVPPDAQAQAPLEDTAAAGKSPAPTGGSDAVSGGARG